MTKKVSNPYLLNLFSKEVLATKNYRLRPVTHSCRLDLPSNLPLWPLFVDQAELSPGQEVRHYNYTRFALEIPLSGNLIGHQRGETTTVLPGQIYLIHYGEDSSFSTGSAGHCRKIGLGVAGPMLGTILAETGLSEHLTLTMTNPRHFFRTIAKMKKAINEYSYENAAEFSGIAFQILTELALMIDDNHPELLIQATAIMKANLSQMLTITELAEKMNTSPSTLEALFNKHLNTSPRKYLMDLKLNKAKQLLTTDLPINQIAMNLGYAYPMHFSRWFRQNVGVSPGKFRKRRETLFTD